MYNVYGEAVKATLYQFTEDKLTVKNQQGTREYKLVERGIMFDYVYKIGKKQISIISIENFKKHIASIVNGNSAFNTFPSENLINQ